MTDDELADLLRRRISNLQQLRAAAAQLGDVDRVLALDADISATQAQLDDLTG